MEDMHNDIKLWGVQYNVLHGKSEIARTIKEAPLETIHNILMLLSNPIA